MKKSGGIIRENRTVRYADVTIPYVLAKSSRRTYAISISQEGTVTLRVPWNAPEHVISNMLTERRQWLTSHYLEAVKKAQAREPGILTAGQKAALDKRFREAAEEYIPKRAAYYRALTGGNYTRITIREQKTRWGSCSARGTLSFNWKLILAPPQVLDYVVVHELCHLSHMDHSREFWQTVERVMPDYRERRRWLKEHGGELSSENFLMRNIPGQSGRS